MYKNRLAYEKSPYLLQHANNPVDWRPWGEEALSLARAENRPIFLSIGYSTCHWCHVMERESFEDEEVARLMNETFVCIKVDREERPDLDSMYMSAAQMISGSLGWPLNIILTPEKKPFYAATYIPKGGLPGRVGMLELIPRIGEVWLRQRERIMEVSAEVAAALRAESGGSAGSSIGMEISDEAYRQFLQRFDEENGGFGTAPKFPTPHNLMFLLRYWKRTGNGKALEMVEKTLLRMRDGGIYDHLGFGFHRYSVDSSWLVPHFEKMLYDQALASMAYLEAYQATGKEGYAETAREIFQYILREMTSPEGGFYSGEDADSEGREGKFYLWTEDGIRDLLGKEDACLFGAVYGVERNGNFIEHGSAAKTYENILHRRVPLSEISARLNLTEEGLIERVEAARAKMLDERERRVRPHKDDKILTDWNGLMIAALARGGRVLDEPLYSDAAGRCAGFILDRMRRGDGRLFHRFRDGESAIDGFLDDYAFLTWGLMELYESTFDPSILRKAISMNDLAIAHFLDEEEGGFFFTADDAEQLIARRKEVYDGAIPSGNSVMILNLRKIGRVTGVPRFENLAEDSGRAFSNRVRQYPSAHACFMTALELGLGPTVEATISGDINGKDTKELIREINTSFVPNMTLILRDAAGVIEEIAPYTRSQVPVDGRAAAYICVDRTCRPPVTEVRDLKGMLAGIYRR